MEKLEKPDNLFVLSGPSGVGKNTVAERLCKRDQVTRAITATTRDPRNGEKEGEDYYFVDEKQFQQWIKDGKLLEHNRYDDNDYGTPAFSVNEAAKHKKPVILVIDVNGALKIREQYPEVTLIFLAPPDERELERRLRDRGDEDEKQLEYRLDRAREEMKLMDKYDRVVINDSLERAVKEVAKIVENQSDSS